MKDLVENKAFVFGFLFGILLFFLIGGTIESRRRGTTICFDCVEEYGFPFTYLETGGFVSITKILWLGLIADVLIAITFSFLIGLIFKFIWSKFTSNELR